MVCTALIATIRHRSIIMGSSFYFFFATQLKGTSVWSNRTEYQSFHLYHNPDIKSFQHCKHFVTTKSNTWPGNAIWKKCSTLSNSLSGFVRAVISRYMLIPSMYSSPPESRANRVQVAGGGSCLLAVLWKVLNVLLHLHALCQLSSTFKNTTSCSVLQPEAECVQTWPHRADLTWNFFHCNVAVPARISSSPGNRQRLDSGNWNKLKSFSGNHN